MDLKECRCHKTLPDMRPAENSWCVQTLVAPTRNPRNDSSHAMLMSGTRARTTCGPLAVQRMTMDDPNFYAGKAPNLSNHHFPYIIYIVKLSKIAGYGWKLSVPRVDGLVLKMTNQFVCPLLCNFSAIAKSLPERSWCRVCILSVEGSTLAIVWNQISSSSWFSDFQWSEIDSLSQIEPFQCVPIDIIR